MVSSSTKHIYFLLKTPTYQSKKQGRNRKIFLRGKVMFPDFFTGVNFFFPIENFHFGISKTNFHFKKWKAKKKKKNLLILELFPPSILNFHLPFYNFSFFSSPFPPFHFPCFFFPVGQQKFPGQKSLGVLCPPPVTPLLKRLPLPLICCKTETKI